MPQHAILQMFGEPLSPHVVIYADMPHGKNRALINQNISR